MTVIGKAPQPRRRLPHGSATQAEETLSAAAYLGAIVLGPLAPLAVYLARRRTSWYVRWHAAQALNVSLTGLLYAVSGAIIGVLLSFDSATAALIVMGPVALAGWVVIVVYLVRGAVNASRGDMHSIPAWICSPLIK
jgi:uncharacterized Tic20 family protein